MIPTTVRAASAETMVIKLAEEEEEERDGDEGVIR